VDEEKLLLMLSNVLMMEQFITAGEKIKLIDEIVKGEVP